MTSTTRSVVIGATLAVVVVGGVVGALLLRGGGGASSAEPTKVVMVFAMPGEDTAVTAQLVAVADAATGAYELVDTSSTVSIPGTSYSLLRDAYPFGGGKAVATALDGGVLKPDTAWVDVDPEAWRRLLASGFEITVTESFETFDEVTERYKEFPVGPQRVDAADLRALLNGLAYLPARERDTVMAALADASTGALASAKPTQGITTDLTSEQWDTIVSRLRKK